MSNVRQERTGWRDRRISERHRRWGWDCPAIDIDFLLLEYDSGRAVAIVEYKHECAAAQCASHPSYQALIDLGNRAGLPVFVVRYADDFSWLRVILLNDKAKHWLPDRQTLNEEEWVRLLYRMRGRKMPAGLFDYSRVVI